jgi:tetratricopeptide (TPR) repeat protein
MKPTLLSCLFLPLFFASALGQNKTPDAPAAPSTAAATSTPASTDYSAEPFVVEHLDSVYRMVADGTGSKTTTVVMRIQSEASLKQVGVLNIPFAAGTQHVEIVYARVRRPDGTVIETHVDQAIEMPTQVTTAAPFYSDLKQMQLPVRSLRVGDTLEWQAKIVMTKPEAPGQFWGQESFAEDGVVLSQTMELRVPKDIYVNVWSAKNKPTDTVEGSERVYRWVASQKKPTVGKEADAEKELKKKQVWTAEQELEAKEGKFPRMAWSTFKSWEAVGAWYQGLESDRIVPDAAVKAKVAELTAGKTTEEEKVRAVYSYVSTQIRYIGVAFGIGRYQPHRAGDVLENQYGDCKDKHTLLAAMLTSLGLHPNAVLIGAGVRFNEAVPSPGAFNHLITSVPVGGKTVWLDSTEEVAPYGALAYVIRDKKALVAPDSGVARIETTPAALPFPSIQRLDAVGTLDKEGTSNSHLVWTMRGDAEMIFRSAFRSVSPTQYDQMVQQISQNIGYAGTTSHAELTHAEDTSSPMVISYDYKREKNGDWDNLKIIPQLAPVGMPQVDDKEPPVQSISLGVPRVEESSSAMKLPDGWGVELPEAVHAKSAFATLDQTYRFEKGTVYAERRVEVLKETVPVTEWKSYKKWADDADLSHEQWIQLVMNGHKDASGNSESPKTSNSAEAARLISSAYKAIQQRNLDEAKTMLDQAKNLNSNQAYLWTTYGYYEFQRGEMSAAVVDYKKELALFPERYGTYGSLSAAQVILGHRKEGMETLRAWAAANGSDVTPVLRLVTMQLEDGNAKDAVSDATAALAREPEKKNERLQLLLGRAYVMAGQKKEGYETLLSLMQSTQSSEMMNDSAYELADSGQNLAEAESATRKALEMMGEESRTWTLDENPQTLLEKSQYIASTWDTIGWILYREGKLDEAEGYLKAAWRNRPSATIGGHLGELAAAKGKKDEALTNFELAIATISQVDMLGVKKAPGAEQKKLQSKADALRKAGAKSGLQDAQSKLRELRTVPMGEARDIDGVAEYRLLLSGGSIARAEKAGTKEMDGGENRLKEIKLPDLWPPASQANLVHNGMLNCHSKVCELVLEL